MLDGSSAVPSTTWHPLPHCVPFLLQNSCSHAVIEFGREAGGDGRSLSGYQHHALHLLLGLCSVMPVGRASPRRGVHQQGSSRSQGVPGTPAPIPLCIGIYRTCTVRVSPPAASEAAYKTHPALLPL